ncbi:MAG: LytTR family DNA-binding domain-containing protein [Negativicutes bacterium]|nr:LytTR family DNA-binding domain-containing protein [Negativicutes bacterium]
MKKLRTFLIDDEPLMCQELQTLLEEYHDIEIIGCCNNSQQALEQIIALKPDLVFLDIQIPGKSGIQLAKSIARLPQVPMIVFATAYQNYAMDAFTVNAVDYILKPFDDSDVQRAINKVRRYATVTIPSAQHPPRKLSADADGRLEIIDQTDIQVIFTENRAIVIQMRDGRILSGKMTLQEYEELLDPQLFCRCHRGHIVNVQYIERLDPWFNRGYLLTLSGAKLREVPVSRVYVKNLRQFIQF